MSAMFLSGGVVGELVFKDPHCVAASPVKTFEG